MINRLVFFIIAVAVAVFVAAFTLFFVSAKNTVVKGAYRLAENSLRYSYEFVENNLSEIEDEITVVKQWILEDFDNDKRIVEALSRMMEINKLLVGMSVAYDNPVKMIYLSRDSTNRLSVKYLQDKASYNYFEMDWYKHSMQTGLKSWSEPYFDAGAGNALMVTCTDVLYDKKGTKTGVVTADVTMADFSRLLGRDIPYPSAVSMMISKGGRFIAHSDSSLLGHSASDVLAADHSDKLKLCIPVPAMDWQMVLLIDKDEVLADFHKMTITLAIIFLLSIAAAIVLMRWTVKHITRPLVSAEAELKIATKIQMSLLPKVFPPFPSREDVDVFAYIKPAKAVGGDLYHFLIKDNKLYFLIGDVSGKGIPAALFMAITKSTFDALVNYFSDPAEILRAINALLTEHESGNMFVTLFVAALDLQTGEMQYCNAGHNPPVLLSCGNKPAFMHINANIPAGVMNDYPYKTEKLQLENHTTLLLYTDGLTEAENSKKELFGNRRLLDTLADTSPNDPPVKIAKRVERAVQTYVNGAEQNDDIALLAVNYSFPHELILPNKTSEIAHINTFLETIGRELQLPPALTMKLNLALEEVVANIVQYAYGGETDRQIVIRVT
ncbi:MAG: SpoIIE family protein phosphatase [Bacteroidales bacterium]|jgi:serine phosphatase RsbU (regulator of sigma subunit)|nr:SpoIIE family protein phosphatase [Bacteroidales bacterium]